MMVDAPHSSDDTSADADARAWLSLEGLSVGDAFGETFFTSHETIIRRVNSREAAPGPWGWTDDTAMAISIVEELAAGGAIDQDRLASRFARRYEREPARGYGGGAHDLLSRISRGERWRPVSRRMFGGVGSFGNGAAMRVAPLGAYFADDPPRAAREAARAAEITHAHPEGIAGAVAVAVAAAVMWRTRREPWERARFLAAVLEHTPTSQTRDGIEEAARLSPDRSIVDVAVALGNGSGVSAPDTVPLVIWCAAADPDSYDESLWLTAMALGDVDTTCAMVGGIVVLRTGIEGIPEAWRQRREPLPAGARNPA